jgi:hypothetical protein
VYPVKYEQGFYIPEDDILHSHRCEILKSYFTSNVFRLLTVVEFFESYNIKQIFLVSRMYIGVYQHSLVVYMSTDHNILQCREGDASQKLM